MSHSLPERPDLEQLKKQAKELLRAFEGGETSAHERVGGQPESFALADAQRVIAREYGFASWAKLKLHVETRSTEDAASRLLDAVLHGEADVAAALLAERPALSTHSPAIAAALGDAENLRHTVERPNAASTGAVGPRNWPLILYVCFGRVGGDDRRRAIAARLLLERGADPNSSWIHPTWPEAPLPALYGATGVNDYPALARVLLEAGANPNDGESRYHAAEHNHVACLEVLAEFGADFSGTDKMWGNTPLCFLLGHTMSPTAAVAGVRWLLDHGADPNVPSYANSTRETPLHVAVRNGWDADTVEHLLRRGADVNAKRADGRTPYALASIFRRAALATVLRRHGANGELTPPDALLAACMEGDRAKVEILSAHAPQMAANLARDDRALLEVAASENRATTLRPLHESGADVLSPISEGATALHWAAWHGRADAVAALLTLGAATDAYDQRFDAPPIGWCAHGSLFCRNPAGEYAAVAEALIAAGACVPPGIEGSSEVMAVLRKHGASAGPRS